jgi:hypothetical protein
MHQRPFLILFGGAYGLKQHPISVMIIHAATFKELHGKLPDSSFKYLEVI